MDSNGPNSHPRHPIQVVARRTGLSPDVLRAWERRYGVVNPGRSAGSHRLYSDADIDRLTLIRQAMAGGRRIHQVARLTAQELLGLLEEDRQSRIAPAPVVKFEARVTGEGDAFELGSFLAAVQALDQPRLEALLADAALRLPAPSLVENLLTPLMTEIGDEWCAGRLRVAHEHMATAAVRSLLGGLRSPQLPQPGSPELIVATPAGQQHELGALSVAILAEADGWLVTYLGANVPADDLASAARHRGARAVALSINYPPDDPQLPREFARLRRGLPQGVDVLAGGKNAGTYRTALQSIGAFVFDDQPGFRRQLETLRRHAG